MTVTIVLTCMLLLMGFFTWSIYSYKKLLLEKAKKQETEFILGKPVVLVLEEDYIKLVHEK